MRDMNTHQNVARPFWKQPESRRLEFKEIFPGGDQIAKTAIAFANGAGGKIVFGVRDNPRDIVGIPDREIFLLEERISDHLFTQCAPNIIPEIFIQSAEGKSLLVVRIFPGSHKPYYLRKKGRHQGTFIRVGSTNRPASQETLESLERQRRNISFDSVPAYDVRWQDTDLKEFLSDYTEATGRVLRDTHLKNLGLMVREQDQVFPSNAAVLLSDSLHRSRLFPFAKIECARFKGVTMDVFTDQATVSLPVHKAPEACMMFVKKNIALGATIGEIYRKNRWEYPLKAIREAVINAVVHRDYALMGSDIKIAVYDDMLEITSPGPLPDTLSPEDLGTGRSVIRNRTLALIFKDLGLIEAWGSGMLKIRQALSEYPETDVVFRETGHAFQVQFRKQEDNGGRLVPGKHQAGTRLAPGRHQAGTRLAPGSEQLRILESCKIQLAISELLKIAGRSDRTKFRKTVLNPLMNNGLLAMTDPDKPSSPKQKYKTTPAGIEKLERNSVPTGTTENSPAIQDLGPS